MGQMEIKCLRHFQTKLLEVGDLQRVFYQALFGYRFELDGFTALRASVFSNRHADQTGRWRTDLFRATSCREVGP